MPGDCGGMTTPRPTDATSAAANNDHMTIVSSQKQFCVLCQAPLSILDHFPDKYRSVR